MPLKLDTYCCTPVGIHAPGIQLCKAIHLYNRIPRTEHGDFVQFYFALEGCPVRLSVTKPLILTEVLRSFHYLHRNNFKIAYDCFFPILHNSPLGVFVSFGVLYRTNEKSEGKFVPMFNWISTTQWRCMDEWMCISMYSWHRHFLEVSDQLYAPAALPPEKESPVPIG
jgi:hypothetical protein